MLAWVPMVPLAIGNAFLRERVYGPRLSELAAHQASTGTLILLLGIYAWIILAIFPPRAFPHAAVVGLWWALLTIGFEFSFGRYVAGHSWSRLLADYDLTAGRLWFLVPLWLAAAPVLLFQLRRKRGKGGANDSRSP